MLFLTQDISSNFWHSQQIKFVLMEHTYTWNIWYETVKRTTFIKGYFQIN